MNAISPTLSRAGGASTAAAAPARASDISALKPARFVPGMVIAERYRIVAQIGRGGMGEVYRADDLRLGQTVALKFLPEALSHDEAALARLHREVRTARQVSHPNVCRVFDIGEADKIPFITMEFVDGEDLASLLRRIGRLQPGKALQLAHQLCAGLAEIHAFGILHRDLKPANIMLDGRGNLRITDFGLAVVAQEIPGEEAQAGTPAYMAPEQLAGEKPTQQSDIYALGLILFELFTGKPAFESLRTRDKSMLKPSAIAKDVDPVVERAILRCLEKEPTARPRTATVVGSALPGGDPLAAAIAAGETPSPDMVAAAADEPAVSVISASLLLGVFILAIVGCVVATGYCTIARLAPAAKPPEILADHAQQIISSLGYTDTPVDTVSWAWDDDLELKYLVAHEPTNVWMRKLTQVYPGVQRFTYVQSPRTFDTQLGIFNRFYPPAERPGLATVEMDQRGRLRLFRFVPPIAEARSDSPDVDWRPLFAAAGLDPAKFTPAAAQRHPPAGFDRQNAWEGQLDGRQLQIVAAALAGRPVYFELFAPWDPQQGRDPFHDSVPPLAFQAGSLVVLVLLWSVGIALARRHWRAGRGDRVAAFRVTVVVFVLYALSNLLEYHHAATFLEYPRGVIACGWAAHMAILAGVLYLALEPLVRRRWPTYLVSWTRLLSGRWNNAQVGRDLLIGAAAGALISFLEYAGHALAFWKNLPGALPFAVWVPPLASLPVFLSAVATGVGAGVWAGVVVLTIVLLLGLLVRNTTATLVIAWLLFALFHVSIAGDGNMWLALVLGLLHSAIAVALLARIGLLALIVSDASAWVLQVPLMPAGWHLGRTAFVLALTTGFALFAYRTALMGRSMLGTALLDE